MKITNKETPTIDLTDGNDDVDEVPSKQIMLDKSIKIVHSNLNLSTALESPTSPVIIIYF